LHEVGEREPRRIDSLILQQIRDALPMTSFAGVKEKT